MPMDKPSVSRRVWYWPRESERNYIDDGAPPQPFDAGIARVNLDGTINVSVINDLGYPMTPLQNVALRETPDQARPGECSWMPYQVKKALADAPASAQSPSEPLPGG